MEEAGCVEGVAGVAAAAVAAEADAATARATATPLGKEEQGGCCCGCSTVRVKRL